MRNVFWTELGRISFERVVEFTAEKSLKAAFDLEEKVERLVIRLSNFNFSCPPSPKLPRYRWCVITKNASLIYEIQEGGIFIVAVVDNRSDHLYF